MAHTFKSPVISWIRFASIYKNHIFKTLGGKKTNSYLVLAYIIILHFHMPAPCSLAYDKYWMEDGADGWHRKT